LFTKRVVYVLPGLFNVIALALCPLIIIIQGVILMWTKPAYKEIRLGFEVTMYCYTR